MKGKLISLNSKWCNAYTSPTLTKRKKQKRREKKKEHLCKPNKFKAKPSQAKNCKQSHASHLLISQSVIDTSKWQVIFSPGGGIGAVLVLLLPISHGLMTKPTCPISVCSSNFEST